MSQCFRCLHLATSSFCARAPRHLECSSVLVQTRWRRLETVCLFTMNGANRSRLCSGGRSVVAAAEDGHEGFLADFDIADGLHSLLALFLLLKQFLFT